MEKGQSDLPRVHYLMKTTYSCRVFRLTVGYGYSVESWALFYLSNYR